MSIPIQNLYYLLCYSWDKLEEKDIVNVHAEDFTELVDLFAKVLIEGCLHLFKRGLDRSYVPIEETIGGIKAKLDLSTSLKRDLLPKGKAHCIYDELSYNILSNQILKTTIRKLIYTENLDSELKDELRGLYKRFSGVNEIKINNRHFSLVTFSKSNSFYAFLLNICEIIYDTVLINEQTGTYKFKDFVRDEKKMAALFESFVRNFYKKEQNNYRVYSEVIHWQLIPVDELSKACLPLMKTDICLESATKKIVIDTKYYKEALVGRFENEKIISSNLYQIFSYLKNLESTGGSRALEGVLLYPTVYDDIQLGYTLGNNKLAVRTINLNQDWKEIRKNLLDINL